MSLPLDALHHADPSVRASALRALVRGEVITAAQITEALSDAHHEVRRTAVELAAECPEVDVHHLINDPDIFVAEMTAWCLGEREEPSDVDVETLISNCTGHSEQLVREACAAALGSIGDPRGRDAVLAACNDKPAVRRRAVLALSVFEGPEVEAAIDKALTDTDWQVRQNAEILRRPYND